MRKLSPENFSDWPKICEFVSGKILGLFTWLLLSGPEVWREERREDL